MELDERTGLYYDIGDKKATDKASQALREGQKKIRKQIYKDEEKMIAKRMYDTSLLATRPSQNGRGISSEGYFGYSVQVLESLYRMDENENTSWAPASAQLLPVQSQTLASAPIPNAVPNVVNSDSSLAHMAMVLDQFPGAVQAPPPHEPDPRVPDASVPPPPSQTPTLRSEIRRSVGGFTDEASMRGSITELGRCTLARLSNISFTSTSSISQMLELARGEPKWTADGHRNSIESILSDEIRDLIKISEPQLKQVENMTMNELVDGVKEIRVEADMENVARTDRVSDLRFTDLSSDGAFVDDGNVADAQLLLRLSNGI